MNVQFKCTINRYAIIDPKLTGGKIINVGVVEEYSRTDTEIKVNIHLNEDLPGELLEGIKTNPGCLRISEGISPPQEVLIIPARPKIIT